MPQVLPIVGPPPGQSTLTDGAANDSALESIKRFLPPAYKNKPGWEALIAALGDGDAFVREQVFKAFDQLFLSSASGNYLIERAADQGVVYPESAGITESFFRELAILLANNRQIAKALLGILEVFYGYDSTHARMESVAAPFDLQAGDTITFVLDDRVTVTATIDSNDYANINAATAQEVAGALSRAFRDAKSEAFALAQTIDGTERVVVYSGAVGLLGSIEVTGGMANYALGFPTSIPWVDSDDFYSGNQWQRILVSYDEFRLVWTQTRSPGNLNQVQVGDYVLLNLTNDASLRGSYEVIDVQIDADPVTGDYDTVTWFSIKPTPDFPYSTIGGPATSFNVPDSGEIVFYRPTRNTVVQNDNPSYIAQHNPTVGVDIILPVTTQAVGRAYNAAAYIHDTTGIAITDVWRCPDGIIVTAPGFTFSVGDMVELRGVTGSFYVGTPPANFGISTSTYSAPITIVAGVNDRLDFTLVTFARVVTLTPGTYTLAAFEALIQAALFADFDNTWVVDDIAGHIRITGAGTWAPVPLGPNQARQAWTTVGFTNNVYAPELVTRFGEALPAQVSGVPAAGGWELMGKVTATVAGTEVLPGAFLPADSFFIARENSQYTNGYGSGGYAYAVAGPIDDGIGPYVYDESGFSVTATETTCSDTLSAGRGVSTLRVASTTGFPNAEGWIVLGFGTAYENGPIRLLGVIDGSNLAVDRSFILGTQVPAGSSVTLLSTKGPYVPDDGALAFTITDSSAGRVAAESFIDESVAAGVEVNKIVVYPGDRGLGGQGDGITGVQLSDKVAIWAGDEVDAAVEAAHNA